MKRVRLLTLTAIALLPFGLPASGSAETAPGVQRSTYTAFDAGLTVVAGVILQQPVDLRFQPEPGAVAISRRGVSLVWPLPHSVAPRVASFAAAFDLEIDVFFRSLLRGAAVASTPTP